MARTIGAWPAILTSGRESFFQLEELGKRGDGLFPARKPSIGWWNVECISLDELFGQPDQGELVGDRVLIECVFHAL
jgi:hypothetical protein